MGRKKVVDEMKVDVGNQTAAQIADAFRAVSREQDKLSGGMGDLFKKRDALQRQVDGSGLDWEKADSLRLQLEQLVGEIKVQEQRLNTAMARRKAFAEAYVAQFHVEAKQKVAGVTAKYEAADAEARLAEQSAKALRRKADELGAELPPGARDIEPGEQRVGTR